METVSLLLQIMQYFLASTMMHAKTDASFVLILKLHYTCILNSVYECSIAAVAYAVSNSVKHMHFSQRIL